MESPLLKQTTAAARLGVSRQRVSQMMYEGKLPTVTVDGSRYTTEAGVAIWLARTAHQETP